MARATRYSAGMSFESRLALYFAAIFAAIGIQMPFLPVWFAARGLSEETIGFLLAVAGAMRMLAVPLATRATDRHGALKAGLVLASFAAAAGALVLGSAGSVSLMFVGFGVVSAAVSTAIPLADAYALKGLPGRGRAYGPVRLWGSVAFIAGNLGTGYLTGVIAPGDLIWPIAGAFWATALVATMLAPLPADPPRPLEPAFAGTRFLRTRAFLCVVAACSLVQGSHAVYYAFSSLDWTARGLSGVAVGALWSIGVIAEIALFAVSARLPFGPAALLGLGALGAALRWILMALDPPAALLPLLQALHALSFGATHLGAVQYLARAAPPGLAATGQGLLAVGTGFATAVATASSGVLHAAFGSASYAAMAAMALAGAALAAAAARPRGAGARSVSQ
jgi:PPP family 3-phenylpropionic acid transporter